MCGQWTIHKRPLILCATAGPSIRIPSTFCTTVFPCVLSAYVNFTCVRRTICQLFLWQKDIPSIFVRPQDSLSIFSASAGPSINFHQLSVRPLNLPSTSINIPCGCGTFHQLSGYQGTFCQLPSSFCASEGLSIKFLCISVNILSS